MSTQVHFKRNGSSAHNIQEQYEHLRDAVQEAATQSRKNFDRLCRDAEHAIEANAEKLRAAKTQVQRSVRKNPWPVIGGAALGALLIGFAAGRATRHKEAWER